MNAMFVSKLRLLDSDFYLKVDPSFENSKISLVATNGINSFSTACKLSRQASR
jgi:hypothetical protein